MKTVILIAVRLHSTRLPKKALIKLGEKTLLEHLIDNVKQAKEPDDIIICTSIHEDDREIISLASAIGIKCFAGSEDDVMDRFIQVAQRENADTIVRVTGDNPLTDPEIMDQMIRFHIKEMKEYTYTEDPPRGTRCEILNVDAMKKAHMLAEDTSQTEYMSLYFRQPKFFRISKFIVVDSLLRRPQYRLTVDTPEDLELMKALYESLYDHNKDRFPSLRTIIEFLDRNPTIVAINRDIESKWEKLNINARLRRCL